MYVRATVTPGAKRESIEKVGEQRFALTVREPAERNAANTRVLELLAHAYDVPTARVRIVSGHHSPHKIFDVSLPS